MRTLNEEITLDCKRDPCNVCGHQDINGDCTHKIAELVSMHRSGDTFKRDRTIEVAERVGAPLTLV